MRTEAILKNMKMLIRHCIFQNKRTLQRNLHSESKRLGQTAPKRNETRVVQSKQARRCANRIDFLHQRHDRIPSADRQGRGRAAGKEDRQDHYPAPGLSEETLPYYTSAYDLDMRCVIDTYAAAQKHVDQGLSMTLFMRSKPSAELYEWKKVTKRN